MESFFSTLFEYCDGMIELRTMPAVRQKFFNITDDKKIPEYVNRSIDKNVYFGVATRDGNGGRKENIVHIPAAYCDIDFKTTSVDNFKNRIKKFPFRSSLSIHSGAGCHLYWKLNEPAEKSDIATVEDVNRRIAHALGGDLNSTDAARILRVPEHHNQKYNPPRSVRIIKINPFFYELDNFLEILPEPPIKSENKSIYSLEKVTMRVDRCAFIKWCRDSPNDVSEPLWYALITNLTCVRPYGHKLVHEYSREYCQYSPEKTDKKILHALDGPGPHTCRFIQENGFNGCTACGVKSPAVLLRFNNKENEKNNGGTYAKGQFKLY